MLLILQPQHNIWTATGDPLPPCQNEQPTPDEGINEAERAQSSAFSDFFSLFQDLEELEEYRHETKTPPREKEWTIITYMAADNDLAHFARRNLVQQAAIGSNDKLNIVTQLDTRMTGNKKITKRYYVEQGKLILTNFDDPSTQQMDSGNPNTLIDCIRWAVENYPAKHYMLILWNHGTGTIDIGKPRMINPSELFTFNSGKGLYELDRSVSFLDIVEATQATDYRGICFDDTTGHYLTNQDLEYALDTACNKLLGGKKIDIIAFDACLMAMIEIANIIKKHADYMVASQEVELGTGYQYELTLKPLMQQIDKKSLAQHMVATYGKTYERITGDYTQSALDLNLLAELESNIDNVALLLIESLKHQKSNSVREAIKTSRHKLLCTHFDEPSYIDLYHFYTNLLSNLKQFSFEHTTDGSFLMSGLQKRLNEGLELIKKVVVANTTGKNLKQARGISIYFPERRIHSSYPKNKFAKSNRWLTFLKAYLAKK